MAAEKVTVRIPAQLRRLADGEPRVEVEGETVAEVIGRLEERYQGIHSELVSEDGEIHRYVNIYLNDEDIRFLDMLETRVTGGDVISILPAVAGGLARW